MTPNLVVEEALEMNPSEGTGYEAAGVLGNDGLGLSALIKTMRATESLRYNARSAPLPKVPATKLRMDGNGSIHTHLKETFWKEKY